jgi:hypothetical protein
VDPLKEIWYELQDRFNLSNRDLTVALTIIVVILCLVLVLAGTLLGGLQARSSVPAATRRPTLRPPPSFTPPPSATPTPIGTWLQHEPIAGVVLSLPPEFSGNFTSEYGINFDEIIVPIFESALHRAELFALVQDPDVPYLAYDQENSDSLTLFWIETIAFVGAGPAGLEAYLDSVVEASEAAGPIIDNREVLLAGENVLGRLIMLLDYEIAGVPTTYRVVQYALYRDETIYNFYFRSEADEIAIRIGLFDDIAETIQVRP